MQIAEKKFTNENTLSIKVFEPKVTSMFQSDKKIVASPTIIEEEVDKFSIESDTNKKRKPNLFNTLPPKLLFTKPMQEISDKEEDKDTPYNYNQRIFKIMNSNPASRLNISRVPDSQTLLPPSDYNLMYRRSV